MRLWGVLLVVGSTVLGVAANAGATDRVVCPLAFRQLRELPSPKQARILKAYGEFNPTAKKGLATLLWTNPATPGNSWGAEVLDGIFENFPTGSTNPVNPFGSNEGLFKAIGDLADVTPGGLQLRPGVEKTVRELSMPWDVNYTSQGAAFDLYMTQDIGPARVLGMQTDTPVPHPDPLRNYTRKIDVTEECPIPCAGLDGVAHENKNITALMEASPQELAGIVEGDFFYYGNGALKRLAKEFAEDILIHQANRLDFYRLNVRLPAALQAQQHQVLVQVLAMQFDSPLVASAIQDPLRRSALRDEFLAKLNTAVRYFPY